MRKRIVIAVVLSLVAIVAITLVLMRFNGRQEPVTAVQQKLEAEAMTPLSGDQDVWEDDSASAGNKRILWDDGAVEGQLVFANETTQLTIRGKGDHYGDDYPQGVVSVDGDVVGAIAFDSEAWQDYVVNGDWSAGEHAVKIEYDNDERYRGVILDSIVAGAAQHESSSETIEPAEGSTNTDSLPMLEPTATPTGSSSSVATASQCITDGSGGEFTDRYDQTFTGADLTSDYHVYAADLQADQPLGLLVQLHGDGAYEFGYPTDDKLEGMAEVAQTHNLLMIAARTPDNDGAITWWEEGEANAAWLQALLDEVAYNGYVIDKSRVWLSGYSGGAQLLTQYYIDQYSDTFCGGGAVVAGGGTANSRMPGESVATESFQQDFRLHFYTGQDDRGTDPENFDAYNHAVNGAQFYESQGYTKVTTEFPEGVDHDNLDEVTVLRERLDAAYSS